MFLGSFLHTIDDKGRVVLPSTLRTHFANSDTLIISPGLQGQLALTHPDEYAGLLHREAAQSMKLSTARRVRFLSYEATTVKLDKAGRVLLPEKMRESVGIALGSEVVVAGAHTHVEVWNPQAFETERAKALADIERQVEREEREEEIGS